MKRLSRIVTLPLLLLGRRCRRFASSVTISLAWIGLVISSANAETVFRYVNFGDLESLDPQKVNTVQEETVLGNLFLPLLTNAATGQVIPGAAESWTSSPDKLVYTFTLRPHLWSDGTPVTADDFVFAFRRLLDPATASPTASEFYVLKNGQAYNEGKARAEDVGVKALSPNTLELTLANPTGYVFDLLAKYFTAPMPRHVIEKEGDSWALPGKMVSNGAYVLASYRPNDETVLVKNKEFYDAASVKIDKAVFYAQEDVSEHLKRFRAGEVEATDTIPPDQLEWALKTFPEEAQVKPYLGLHYYVFNTTKPPFNDVRIRQALSLVIDRETISNKVMKTGEIPAYSEVPPGISSYGLPTEVVWKNWPMEKRLAEAKRLMAEAGYGPDRPLKFQLRYNTSDAHKRRAIAISAMWKQTLGVEVDLFNVEGKVYFADMRVRNFEVARSGGIAQYADASNFLSTYETRTGSENFAGYSNPEYDTLMLEASKTADIDARSKRLHQAEALLMRDQPIIPLAYYVSTHLVSKRVKGWEGNSLDCHWLRWMDVKP